MEVLARSQKELLLIITVIMVMIAANFSRMLTKYQTVVHTFRTTLGSRSH